MLLPFRCFLPAIYNQAFVSVTYRGIPSLNSSLAMYAPVDSANLSIFPSENLDMLAEKIADDIKNHK